MFKLYGVRIELLTYLLNYFQKTKVHQSIEVVIITVNGRSDTAVLGLQDYYQMNAELELLRKLADSEDDVKNSRIGSMQNCFDGLRRNRKRDEIKSK